MSFNPRVLAGGHDFLEDNVAQAAEFQSARPRGRTRHGNYGHLRQLRVSIRASSREDTTATYEVDK